jgi:hypothetical protein
MMNEYFPDKWQIIEIKTPDSTIQKVLASWYGDYAGSDEWRLSSGITEAIENEGHYLFHNESGSIYKCFKESQGMSAYTAGVFEDLKKDLPEGTSITIDEY